MRKTLTQAAVDRVAPPRSGRIEFWDAVVPGLHLRITSTGHRTFALMTRLRGRQVRLTIGKAGSMKLSDVRDEARDALRKVERGIDPRDERRQLRAARSDDAGAVIDDFIARYVEKNNRPRSAAESKRALISYVKPAWKGRSIREVTRREVIDLLEEIAVKAPATAVRTRGVISKLFAWSLDRGIVAGSPAVRLPTPAPIIERDRVLNDDELRILWQAFDATPYPNGPYFKLLLLTAQRRSELATVRWSDLNLGKAEWLISAERAKSKREHLVPLSPLAVDILKALPRRTGDFVFTTRPEGDRPISGLPQCRQVAAEPRLRNLRRPPAPRLRRGKNETARAWGGLHRPTHRQRAVALVPRIRSGSRTKILIHCVKVPIRIVSFYSTVIHQ